MPNDVGVGFFGMVVRGGAKKYRAIWLHKNKFAEPTDEMSTTGEKAEFKSSKIEGTILATESGVWKDETLVATETAAIAWLNGKANITEGGT
ncbi:hypothetical protein FACS1894120_6560 [Clostridia bacterium]|nr:hypothetical protein FACS1894120_6560 [Clostridia bacterium]